MTGCVHAFWAEIRYRPKAKEEGPTPRGAARKGRAYLIGKRFGISKVIMIIGATNRRGAAEMASPEPQRIP